MTQPGKTWESWREWQDETWQPPADTSTPGMNAPQPPPIPNRATRRALYRARKDRRR